MRPSLTEGRSLTILEAMASGACVVASDIVPNRELIRHGVTGILTPVGDRLLLAEALRQLVDDAARRLSIGVAARDAILRSTWGATASKTAEVLVEVASEAAPESDQEPVLLSGWTPVSFHLVTPRSPDSTCRRSLRVSERNRSRAIRRLAHGDQRQRIALPSGREHPRLPKHALGKHDWPWLPGPALVATPES